MPEESRQVPAQEGAMSYRWQLLLVVSAAATIPCHAETVEGGGVCWTSNANLPFLVQLQQGCEISGTNLHTNPYLNNIMKSTPNPNDPSAPQLFTGSFNAALSLGTTDAFHLSTSVSLTDYRRDMYIQTDPPTCGSEFLNCNGASNVTSNAIDQLYDAITVNGGTGTFSLSYVLGLDGTFATTGSNLLYQNLCASLDFESYAAAKFQ
jgi:hypothetical protein